MNNNIFTNQKSKNKMWFEQMYNEKLEKLHTKSDGSVTKYLSYEEFSKNNTNKTNYSIIDINNVTFISNYTKFNKESIFYKIVEDIDINFNNPAYTFKDSILYKELKINRFTNLSEYFNLNEPNNLTKYSKFYEFYPWDNMTKILPTKLCGIYSDSIIEMHFIKFKRVLEGLKKYNLKYNIKNMIKGYILKKNNNDFRFVVTSGIHRIIVLKYLNLNNIETTKEKNTHTIINENKRIICENTREIKLEDINNWYYVKNKIISKENAEKIFNFYFK